jgi:GNAT superfamily N-acetyltransferase
MHSRITTPPMNPYSTVSQSVEDSTTQYSVEPTSAGEAGADMLRIWSASGLPSGAAKLKWYYQNNPTANPDVLLIRHRASGAAVGTCTLGYRATQYRQQHVLVANRCDLAVMPEHRRSQVAPKLLKHVYKQGTSKVGLIYGFPNPLAEKAVAAAGFQKLGVFSTYSKILNLSALVTSRLPTQLRFLTASWLPPVERALRNLTSAQTSARRGVTFKLGRPDATFDALWASHAHSNLLIGVRDQAFLNWRFDRSIYPRLQILTAQGPDNELLGYVAFKILNGTVRVIDFLTRPDDGASLQTLMSGLFETTRQAGAHIVHMNFFGTPVVTQALQSVGMIRREGRPVYVAGSMVGQIPVDHFYLTTADEDV